MGLITLPEHGALYSVVAWPTAELGAWLLKLQRELNLSSYGEAHLNLRVPFAYAGDEKRLVDEVRRALCGAKPLKVKFLRWRRFPHVVFMEYALSAPLRELHHRLLEIPGTVPSSYDGANFIPHVSLAIGLCGWAEDSTWERLRLLSPPQRTFTVKAASLTREDGGELREIHTYPLHLPPPPRPAQPYTERL